MATTLNLPYVRFVRQASNGCARSKYSYLGMQTDLLKALQEQSTWKKATCSEKDVTTVTNKVTGSDAVKDEEGRTTSPSTYTYYLQDRFDAFKQGGDVETENATMCGYAGMVAYRYTLPTAQASNIQQLSMRFSMSRYLRSGLRVVAKLSNSATPSDDWAVIRGEEAGAIVTAHTEEQGVNGLKSRGVFAQLVPTLVETRAAEGEVVFTARDFPALGTSARFAYLYVYVSIEDYEDWWEFYENATPRYYSIEGSAQMMGRSTFVTFAGTESQVDDSVFTGCGSLLPLGPSIDLMEKAEAESLLEAYGNFAEGTTHVCFFAPNGRNLNLTQGGTDPIALIALLQQLDRAPTKEGCMFDTAGLNYSTAVSSYVDYNDLAISVCRQKWTDASIQGKTRKQPAFNDNMESFAFRFVLPHSSPQYTPSGTSYTMRALFNFRAFIAPPGKPVYTTLRLKTLGSL